MPHQDHLPFTAQMERSWRLREGASFGELAALGVDPTYEATVIATEQCELYLLTQASNVV